MDRIDRLQRINKTKVVKALSQNYNDYGVERCSYFIAPAKKDGHRIPQRNIFTGFALKNK